MQMTVFGIEIEIFLTALLDLSGFSEEKTRKRGDEHRKHWIWPKQQNSTELDSLRFGMVELTVL